MNSLISITNKLSEKISPLKFSEPVTHVYNPLEYASETVENYLEKRPPQAHLVGPGIMLMAERQEQEVEELRYALTACHIPLNQIPSDIITKTLKGLPEYVLKHNQPFGIAHQYFQD